MLSFKANLLLNYCFFLESDPISKSSTKTTLKSMAHKITRLKAHDHHRQQIFSSMERNSKLTHNSEH